MNNFFQNLPLPAILNWAALFIFVTGLIARAIVYLPRVGHIDLQAIVPLLFEFSMTLWQPLILLALARLIQNKQNS